MRNTLVIFSQRPAILLLLAFTLGCSATPVFAGWDEDLVEELNSRNLCASLDFLKLEIDVLDGIRETEVGDAFRVRAGEPLTFVDVDVFEGGYELQFEITSRGLRSEEAEVQVFFAEPAVVNKAIGNALTTQKYYVRRFDNWKELDQALGLFADTCESSPEEESD